MEIESSEKYYFFKYCDIFDGLKKVKDFVNKYYDLIE